MNSEFNSFKPKISKYKNILIVIKGSPDPDAIASSFALWALLKNAGVDSAIYSPLKPSLRQNSAFVRMLDIPVVFRDIPGNLSAFDAYAVLDHQSRSVSGIPAHLPCAVHIDHHEKISQEQEADFRIIEKRAGSACTIMALLMKETAPEIEHGLTRRVATALLFGIQTDTDRYEHASDYDYEAVEWLSPISDSAIIKEISGMALSGETAVLLRTALKDNIVYKNWFIAGVGFVEEKNRDSIAITADFLLKKVQEPTVIVFGAVIKNDNSGMSVETSFRSRDENLGLNDIIKEITEKGGARKFKGAYQINIDYFVHCPDKNSLWELIRLTTVEILKKRRDNVYITELKGFARRLFSKAYAIIKGK